MSWLPEAEAKTRSMSPIADTPRAVRIQIEEFKVNLIGMKMSKTIFAAFVTFFNYLCKLIVQKTCTTCSLVKQFTKIKQSFFQF